MPPQEATLLVVYDLPICKDRPSKISKKSKILTCASTATRQKAARDRRVGRRNDAHDSGPRRVAGAGRRPGVLEMEGEKGEPK